MPLIADFNGDEVCALTLSASEWSNLKHAYRSGSLILRCGRSAVPKTSHLGYQFFAHKSRTECRLHKGADESIEHSQTKLLVANAAAAAGWTTTVEYPSPDRAWIADVLVERGSRRIAFEIQLSRQSSQEFERRQRRYQVAGIECVWLLGPKNYSTKFSGLQYRITPQIGAQTMTLRMNLVGGTAQVELARAISVLVNGKVRQSLDPYVTHARIVAQAVECRRSECGQRFTRWHLESVDIRTRCGQSARFRIDHHPHDLQLRVEEVIQWQVRERFKQSDLPVPSVYGNPSNSGVTGGYVEQLCPHCRFAQGNHYAGGLRFLARYDLEVGTIDFPLGDSVLAQEHCCEDVGYGACERRTFPRPNFPNITERSSLVMERITGELHPLPARS